MSMYYEDAGGMGSFGMDDLALSEMGVGEAAGSVTAPSGGGVVSSNDISQLGTQAQNLSTIYANYLLAKNKLPPLPCAAGTFRQNPNDPASPCVPMPQAPMMPGGMSETTKMLLMLGVGAVALGGLVWVMKKRKSRNRPSNDDDGWRIIGE